MKANTLIWDLPTRLFHWLLVTALVAQWFTAEFFDDAIELHMQIGYFILGLILFRVIWGFVGPRYARFSNFLSSPKAVIAYCKGDYDHDSRPGHNPLGGLMVIVMLLLIGLQAVSGLFVSDDIFSSGPYHDVADKDWVKTMEWLHHNLYDLIMIAAAIHIGAIIWYKVIKHQALAAAMVTGKKAFDKALAIPSSRLLLALVVGLAVAAFVYWLVAIAPPAGGDEFYY